MRIVRFAILISLPCLMSCTTIPDTAERGIFVGNIWPSTAGVADDVSWSQITPENAGKWESVERRRDSMDWSGLDGAYSYARSIGAAYKHHTLVWAQQQPVWIGTLSEAEQRAEVEEWFFELSQRYPDIELIDVVNEPTHEVPVYADALGGEGETGWDWVVTSFELARRYFPNSILLINDYNILTSRSTIGEYLSIIEILADRGLVDGIGVQGHFLEKTSTSVVEKRLDQLMETGFPVYVSEFDVNDSNDTRQASTFRDLFTVFANHPGVSGITLWGHVENRIWQKDAYLIRADGSFRPAMEWLANYMAGNDGY